MLSPEEIVSREFLVSLRGYDRDEVHAFLEQVADEVRALQAQVAELQSAPAAAPVAAPEVAPEAAPVAVSADASTADTSAMFAEIARETQRILEAAQEAGNELRRRARGDANRELQAARNEAAKVIAEGERRRDQVDRTVAELEARRTAVAESLRNVGRTIEGSLRDLAPEPRSTPVREAIASEALGESRGGGAPRGRGAGSREPDEEPSPAGSPEPEDAEQTAAEAEPAAAPDADDDGSPAPDAEAIAPAAPDADETPSMAPEPQSAEPDPDVVVAPPGAELSGADVDDTVTQPMEAAPPAVEDDASEPRDDVIDGLQPKLVRRVKRGLQDLQNVSLDRLRRAGGRGDADDFLPGDEAAAVPTDLATELLARAHAAGVAAAGGATDEAADAAAADEMAAEFLGEVASRVADGLRSTLRMGLRAGEDQAALGDRVSGVFAELRGTVVDELATAALVGGYERGQLHAWGAQGISRRTWVLGREPRCPEGRCRLNAGAGELPLDDPFPSGHLAPPVHPGCTCTTAPA